MKIKKFVGTSIAECLLKVKKELGENAVILDSRKVARGGPFSFLRTDLVEVIASTEQGFGNQAPGATSAIPARPGARLQSTSGEDYGRTPTEKLNPDPRSPHPINAAELALISEDLRGLKDTVGQITDHLKYKQLPSLPVELEKLHRKLLENGVLDQVAAALTQEMTLSLAGSDFDDHSLLVKSLHERVGKIVKMMSPSGADHKTGREAGGARGKRPRVIALVGPTGVGKTTTLAKLATHTGLYGHKRVALVSADTYRIAAVEQFKTFAAIANIPMEAVYRPGDIGRAIERFSDRDIVLIDTAGRSQNDGGSLRELAAFMEHAGADEVHLVLSMSTRLEDQLDVISKFSTANPKALIFTKLDETTNYGMILNICHSQMQAGRPLLPLSLLTCGQNVPDDVTRPTHAQLVRLVCEREYFKQLTNIQ
jgi:flagellar biosynthesis protein FlhF